MAADHIIGSDTDELMSELSRRHSKKPGNGERAMSMALRLSLVLAGAAYTILISIGGWAYLNHDERIRSLERDRTGMAEMRADVRYIKQSLDELKAEVRDIDRR